MKLTCNHFASPSAFFDVQDDIMSFESDKQVVYLQVYRPVYFQLVDVLLHKAQFPSDQEYASWSSDEKEQFRIYRCVCVCLCLLIFCVSVQYMPFSAIVFMCLRKILADRLIGQLMSVFFPNTLSLNWQLREQETMSCK